MKVTNISILLLSLAEFSSGSRIQLQLDASFLAKNDLISSSSRLKYLTRMERSFDNEKVSGDWFCVWYRFLAPNAIQLRFTFESAKEVERNVLEKENEDCVSYLRSKFFNMQKIDKTGLGGAIDGNDIDHAVDILLEAFKDFRLVLETASSSDFIFIQTYRRKDYKETKHHLEPDYQAIYAAATPQLTF